MNAPLPRPLPLAGSGGRGEGNFRRSQRVGNIEALQWHTPLSRRPQAEGDGCPLGGTGEGCVHDVCPDRDRSEDCVNTTTAVTLLIVGILAAALLSVLVSRWALKYDRRARRKQQDEIRRRRVGGSDRG